MYQPSILINKHWQNPGINPRKETNRPETGLNNKAKIKSHAYIQLGEKALQTVHQTFEPNIPVILHLPALTNTTTDTDTVPTLFVIQEGINCMSTTDYFFTSIKPEPIIVSPHRGNQSKLTAQQAAMGKTPACTMEVLQDTTSSLRMS